MVLAAGVESDEAIVFIDVNDVQDEAAYYRDIDASGAVTVRRPVRFGSFAVREVAPPYCKASLAHQLRLRFVE